MGRLTLNILLSFAQFEREIIGERIRDKKLLTARQGKYIGGQPKLGLDIVDRRYAINEAEEGWTGTRTTIALPILRSLVVLTLSFELKEVPASLDSDGRRLANNRILVTLNGRQMRISGRRASGWSMESSTTGRAGQVFHPTAYWHFCQNLSAVRNHKSAMFFGIFEHETHLG